MSASLAGPQVRVGFAGLGRMGRAIVPRLVGAGHRVTVWTRDADKRRTGMPGTDAVETPRDLTAQSDVVLSMLFDDRAVEDVYLGQAGLLSAACDGRLFVEMSTVRPDTVIRLADHVQSAGATLIDAPVSGSVGPAREGKLLSLVGGPESAVLRAKPVLQCFSRLIAHVGPVGAGAAAKLVIQLPISVYWQCLHEALGIGQRCGLNLSTMLELLADSPAALPALSSKIPVIRGQSDEVSFSLEAARKDLAVMEGTAERLKLAVPVTKAALASYEQAVAEGGGALDIAAKASFRP